MSRAAFVLSCVLAISCASSSRPILFERYGEQWGLPPQAVALTRDAVLETALGRSQYFNPTVVAPVSTALCGVFATITMPPEIAVDKSGSWVLNGGDTRGLIYQARFSGCINRGAGQNMPNGLWLTAKQGGVFAVRYLITSLNAPPSHGAFSIKVNDMK